ncbi:reticulon-3 isoform X1 [Poeciliopsis prolifica]|uniref:reticulon-3 isoform X1 n=1 Tax=Poeciliopsis prolifica TaxID=188132 RepID=UPI00241467A3|nr:reticulon-3 isoform X1 [Poeciliopsis prolifica]
MDTQSSQISSSQGLTDGQNSAAKESKLSDSFLSSSPVSLIQSPQDKRGVQSSDKSTEGVATSLRFSSQPGSFSPSSYSSDTSPTDGQQDSPIKVSPVSERIKALEALAAKKKEPDFRGNGTFTHFRDRHQEKSAPEVLKFSTEGSKAVPDGPKSVTEGPQSPTKRSKFTPEGSISPTEGSKSTAESLKSAVVGPKSPAEVPKLPPEKIIQTPQKAEHSVDQESPESPFEILGDLKQVVDFEETEQWMKTHLPPVPDFDTVGLIKSTNTVSVKGIDGDMPAAFAVVPDAFMDHPVEVPKQNDQLEGEPKKTEVEEFDVNFLPTAYMWDHQEKSSVEDPSNLDLVITASPAPPAEFGPTSPSSSPTVLPDVHQNVSDEKKAIWAGELEQPEANEGDSSGESDDTVIEDHIAECESAPSQSLAQSSNDDTTTPPCNTADLSTEEKETPPPRLERKLMQVPTINVIETDEPNYSEEEMELEAEEDDDYEVVKSPDTGPPNPSEPDPQSAENTGPRARPLETEFMEGYSPPSSPVDSESEYSPKHKILNSSSEKDNKASTLKSEVCPNPADSADLQPDQSHTMSNEIVNEKSPFVVENEEVDFPDNDDDWSDETQEILFKPPMTDPSSKESAPSNEPAVNENRSSTAEEAYIKPTPPPMSSFMQDDIYDRQSFDYDFDISSSLDRTDVKKFNNAKERFLSDPAHTDDAEDKQDLDSAISLNGDDIPKSDSQPSLEDYPENPYSCFQSKTVSSTAEQAVNKKTTNSENVENDNMLPSQKSASHIQHNPETGHNINEMKNRTDGGCPPSEPMDSFVEFMRECLKSKQDEEADSVHQELEPLKTSPLPKTSPSLVMDFEQEHLTISALKDLGNSQEEKEETVNPQHKVSETNQPKSDFSLTQPSDSKPPCSQTNRASDGMYSSDVEAIDEWVAEAYHLAEHVLTAILTHLSVNDLIHWRDPKKSGVVFGLSLLLLLSLAAFSVISVISYMLLALLCVTITFRIYKSVVQAVQKSTEGHPFRELIEKDVTIPPETFRKHVDTSLTHINRALKQMSRLFLVEDLVDSLKLAVVMWMLTYVGAVFNGITILILADILLFAVPPVYEKNKTQIDHYIDLVRTQVNNTIAKLQEKLPGAMKRTKTE